VSLKHLLDLTGGHNDIVEPELLNDNMVQDSQNYEVLGQGGLTLRKEPESYDTTLDTYISSTLSMTRVDSISPPLYPQVKPTNMVGEFMLVVYGLVSGTHEMYLVYEIAAGAWTHLASSVDMLQGLTDAGVDWTTDCKPEYSIGNNRMVITDSVNRAYFILVDNDGDVTSGVMGVPAPTIRATAGAAQTEKMSENPNFTSAEGGSVGLPGLVQIVYTIETEQGDESNPSPVSATIDMQWLRKDDDGIDNSWIGSIPITNLWLPASLTAQERENIKFFNVYVRDVKYSGGQFSSTLQFTQQFIISDKNGANTYRVSLPVELGNLVSYEKDIAPIAVHNAQVGGVPFLGGITEQLEFGIGDFDYFVPITITNNGDDYVDAIVRIRLFDSDSGTSPLTNLQWSEFLAVNMNASPDTLGITTTSGVLVVGEPYEITTFAAGDDFSNMGTVDEITQPKGATGDVFTALETDPDEWSNGSAVKELASDRVRMIDQDLQTPLITYCEGHNAGNYVDIWTKIPYLPNGTRIVYFAWANSGTPVNVTGTHATGRWMDDDSFADARINLWADYTRMPNQNTIVATPCNNPGVIASTQPGANALANRANADNYGTPVFEADGYDIITTASMSFLSQIYHNPAITTPVATQTGINPYIQLNSSATPSRRTLRYETNGLGAVPRSCTVWFRVNVATLDLTIDEAVFSMCSREVSQTLPLVSLILESTGNVKSWRFYISDGTSFVSEDTFGLRDEGNGGGTARGAYPKASGKDYFIGLSWDDASAKASLIIVDTTNFNPANNTPQVDYAEVSIGAIPDTDFSEGYIAFGDNGKNVLGCIDAEYDEIVVMPDVYYSAATQVEMDALINVSNFMPAFPEPVGFSNIDITHNNNISFGDVESAGLETFLNKIKWGEAGGINFPNLYSKLLREPVKALMPSPSFLKFQYENTLVMFTRNTITRFLLDGEPSTWVGDANALVEEGFNGGIYAINTLTRAGEALLWLSENGLILWNPEGFQKISQNVIKITLSDEDDLVGFYQPLRDQYILHDRTNDIGYVYHLRYGTFYKFKGFQLDQGIPRVLSGGTLDENVSLIPWGTNDIYKYPGKTDTTETAFVTTKTFDHIRGVFRRFRFYFTGTPTIATHVIDNILDPTEIMSAPNRTFTGSPIDWADVDLASNGGDYSESGVLHLESKTLASYCTLLVASAPMTAGIEYTLEFDYTETFAGGWILQDFTGVQEFGRVLAAGTDQLITFTIDTAITGGFRLVSLAAASQGDFDNFSLKTKDRNESTSPTAGKWKWITNGLNLGEKIYFKITGAKTILSGMYEYLIRGVR